MRGEFILMCNDQLIAGNKAAKPDEDSALARSESGYLVECARADFFRQPRPKVFPKLKKKLSDSELKDFLNSITSRDEYRSYLSKLNSDDEAQRRPLVIDRIPEMPMQKTVSLWENAITTVAKPERGLAKFERKKLQFQARQIIEAINEEWDRRREEGVDSDEFFKWPTTEAETGDGSISTGAWLEKGMLLYMGYKVGHTDGRDRSVRKLILHEIFEGALPPVFPHRYLNEWGEAGSAGRLQKMAECIAAFARNAKRRRDNKMEVAVGQWESDLEYLYDEYYVGKFHFAWPTAHIDSAH